MKNTAPAFVLLILAGIFPIGQERNFEKLDFLLEHWEGEGTGFGNEKSKIRSEFNLFMDGIYIEVKNESHFEPTEAKPEGEHHVDRGIISFDK